MTERGVALSSQARDLTSTRPNGQQEHRPKDQKLGNGRKARQAISIMIEMTTSSSTGGRNMISKPTIDNRNNVLTV